MEIMGLAGGPVRGPGEDLTPDERGELCRLMIDIGLLET